MALEYLPNGQILVFLLGETRLYGPNGEGPLQSIATRTKHEGNTAPALFALAVQFALSFGHVHAIAMRREVAELMSENEIATAQREARAWMTTH